MATVFFTGFPGQLGSELVPRVLSRPGDAEAVCVLGGHLSERFSQGLVDGILVPHRDAAEVRLDLRPESLDRRVVRAVGRQGQEPGTRAPDGRRRGIGLMGDRLSHTTTSPACSSGTSTCSTYDSNAAVSVDPGNTGGHVPRADPTRRSRAAIPTSRGLSGRLARRAGPSGRPGSSPWSPPTRPRKRAVSARPASPSSGTTAASPGRRAGRSRRRAGSSSCRSISGAAGHARSSSGCS